LVKQNKKVELEMSKEKEASKCQAKDAAAASHQKKPEWFTKKLY